MRLASDKERLNDDEYSMQRNARVFLEPTDRARGHLAGPAHVLVDATRIVGEPLDLYCAPGSSCRRSGRLPVRHYCSAGTPHEYRDGARPGQAAGPDRIAIRRCGRADAGPRPFFWGVL